MRPSGAAEQAAGIDWFVTDGPPCLAVAKSVPEDFRVEEEISVPDMVGDARPGHFPLYRIEKRGLDTMHMADELEDALRSRVSYAGLKDKRAVSVQYATPVSARSARPQEVVREKFTARIVGYVPRPLTRAALVGNGFAVALRHCCPDAGARVAEAFQAASEGRVPNYYGLQRFGVGGAGTHKVGAAMVRGDFREAVRAMITADGPPDGSLEEAFEEERYEDIARALPPGKDSEAAVARELGRRPGDWVRALRVLPVKLRRLYVQAYQSYLFNKTMSLAAGEGEDLSTLAAGDNWAEASAGGLVTSAPRGVREVPTADAVPLVQMVGYAFRNYGSRFDALVLRVLEVEGVAPGSFYLPKMQEVSQEGGFRRPAIVLRRGEWGVEGETATLKFALPKGQYATILLREIVKADDPRSAGLA